MSAQNLKVFRLYMWGGALLMALLYLVLVGYLGGSDYDQAVADHEWACQMISERVWPKDPGIDCPEPMQTLAANTVTR